MPGARAAQAANPAAALHSAPGGEEDSTAVLAEPPRSQHPPAAAFSNWHRRAFHTSATAAWAADTPEGGQPLPPSQQQQQQADSKGSKGVAADAAAVEGGGESESDGEDEEGLEHIHKAFEDLIQAAYEMVQEGKPMEAEYLLREGAKSAEDILGEGCVEVAPLYDQLAMISFYHDRIEEAKEPALRAYDILKEHEGEDSPVTAIAVVRYATLLLASGQAEAALPYFQRGAASLEGALDFLKGAKGEVEEETGLEELAMAMAKFEVGLAEATYYGALSKLAMSSRDAEAIEASERDMVNAVRTMGVHLGTEQPLVGAALREHHRLIEQTLESNDFETAEALYTQQVRLHEAYDPGSEHVAMLGYQAGTLQYVMGKYEEAASTLERALHVVRTSFEDVEDYLLTVKHRLGMAYGALGQHDRARAMLQEVAGKLVEKLGEDNPITHELNFMVALMEYKDALAHVPAGEAEAKRKKLAEDMQLHVTKLGSYGDEHMLVKKAQAQLDAALANSKSS